MCLIRHKMVKSCQIRCSHAESCVRLVSDDRHESSSLRNKSNNRRRRRWISVNRRFLDCIILLHGRRHLWRSAVR